MQRDFIKKWLKEHKCCVLVTSYQDKPWAATVNYTVDDDFNIYISSRPESLKFQNLLKNPTICLVIDNQTEEGTLQIQGIAQAIKPEVLGKPNLVVKPQFLIFKRKHQSGKIETLKLSLDQKH